MGLLLMGAATLLVLGILGFYQANRILYTLFFTLAIFLTHRLNLIGAGSATCLWLILLAAVCIWFIPRLRQHFLTRPLFSWFRKQLPPLSVTEKEALEAGDIWWEANLFRGDIDWQAFLSLPAAKLTEAEQAFLDHQVNVLCEKMSDWEITFEKADLPAPVWEYLKKERFFGMIIPKSYGGLGFSAYAHSCVVSKIASRSISAAVSAMVPNSLGPAELLMHFGTDSQKEYYLRKLASGEEIPCFALTAPEAGSDAGSIPDRGVVCKGQYQGKEVLGISLTWKKRYITLAPIATVLGLAVKLYDPDGLLGKDIELGITLCLLPADYPGVKIGRRHFPLDMAFLNGPTEGESVFVPMDFVIGGQKMIGRGWQMLMSCLGAGRGISLPALANASVAVSYFTSGAYARLREQFGVSIGEFEGIQLVLGRMGGLAYLMESMRRFVCVGLDLGKKPAIANAIAKYHMTEICRQVVNDAMDIQAGKGIILGPNNYMARSYEAVPISITVEGANILTRNLMIFGQGAMRCHPFLQQELAAAGQPLEEGLAIFDRLLMQHGAYFWSRLVRLVSLSFTRARFAKKPHNDWTARYFQKLEWMSLALSVVSEVALMVLGGQLKRKEALSARLGDVLSQLFLASSVLKRYHEGHQDHVEKVHAQWALHDCFQFAQNAFSEFFKNFTPRFMASILRFLAFPLGYPCGKLKDSVTFEVAQTLMQITETRSAQTAFIYIGNETQPLGCLEKALRLAVEVAPLRSKIKEAIKAKRSPKKDRLKDLYIMASREKIITEEELALLQHFETLRDRVIAVDDFDPSTLARKQHD